VIHLANRIANLPIVIIGTYRGGYSEHNHALGRTLEELIRLGVRPLKLGGLSKDDIAQMLQGLSQRQPPESLVSVVFEESQGNPFFVEEVYRHLVEDGKVFDGVGQFRTDITIDEIDVPENVRLIIGRRLERLDENEKRVLTAADSGNGVSVTLDWTRFLFINVDLSVYLERMPVGEWICLDAVTRPQPNGIGVADTLLLDERGRIGRGLQSLLVGERN